MTRALVRHLTLGLAAALAAACSDDSGGGPPPPVYLESVVEANPNTVLAAAVRVRASGYDAARVRAFADGDTLDLSPPFPFEGDSVARVPVLGLLPDREYSIEVRLTDGAAEAAVDTVTFASGALPGWIPGMGATGTGSAGLVALSLPDGAVVVDNEARVRWYRHSPNGVLNSFQAHANGTYTILDLADQADRKFRVLDVEGDEIGTLACVGRPTRFHDVLVLADGSAWILCDETRTMDLSGLGGVADAEVTGTVVQHRLANGTVAFEWSVFDHFAITDLAEANRDGAAVNFTHGNAVALDTDGNLLLSFRSLDEVTKVDVATGDVIWRLGGLAGEFDFPDDPVGGFHRQHGVRPVAPGVLQMLDNGLVSPSRLARYAVDPGAGTATLLWGFADSPTTFTLIGGSSQALAPGGGALVSFGTEGRVVETDADGVRTWEITGVDDTYIFRAQRIASLYQP